MLTISDIHRSLCLFLLLIPASPQANTQIYTSQSNFLAAVNISGTDNFSDITFSSELASPLTRNAGTYTYSASTISAFFGAGSASDPWLSTDDATSSIYFDGFSGGVTAIGGNFFGSNIDGNFEPGDVTVTIFNLSESVTWTIADASPTSFLGFTSLVPITSLVLRAEQPATLLWPTVDNLTFAVAVVPEPDSCVLMLAGLAILGLRVRPIRWAGGLSPS